MTKKDKDVFWRIVKECLIQIHNFNKTNAKQESLKFRKKIEKSKKYDLEIIYHDEPFYVACDIANNKLDLVKYKKQYNSICGNKYGAW